MSANSYREFAISWLRLAEEDLKSARKLLSPPEPLWNTAVYHCQQAAEKASKALLALHGEDIPLKHDIGLLLEKLEKYEKGLIGLEPAAETVVDLAEADAEPAWKVALAQVGPGLDQLRQARRLPWAGRFWPAGSRSAGVWGCRELGSTCAFQS